MNGAPTPNRLDTFDQAMNRLRVMGALVILAIAIGYRPTDAPPLAIGLGLFVAVCLVGVNLLGRVITEGADSVRVAGVVIAQIAADVVLVVIGLYAFNVEATNPATLVLVVPVLEAAVRFRVLGAICCWGGCCVALVVHGLAADGGATPQNLIELSQVGAVLLCIALPVAYVAEHLVGDILDTARAKFIAERRAETLSVLALSGRDVNALSIDDIYDAVVVAAHRLGGLAANGQIWDGHTWQQVQADKPEPHPAVHLLLRRLDPPTDDWVDGITVDDAGKWPVIALRVTTGDHRLLVRIAAESLWVRLISEALEVLQVQASVALRNAELHERMKMLTTELTHHAQHDALTGLANRRRLLSVLETELANDNHPGFALLYVDLDGFKPINDRLGHLAGDELLVIVAKRLKAAAGATAMTVRMGGDEFAVLIQDDNPMARGENVRDKIAKAVTDPITLGPNQVQVGASVGIAVTLPGEACDTSELIHRADGLMYQEKRQRKAAATAAATAVAG